MFTWDQDQLVGSVKVAFAVAPPPPTKLCASGISHHAFRPIAQGTAAANHFSSRHAAPRPSSSAASTGVPATAQAYATTSIGGLKPKNEVGISANPAIGVGTRRPWATRIATPVMNATDPTEMTLSGFGSRVRKNPLSMPNDPATTMPVSLRTNAPARYATPKPTRP